MALKTVAVVGASGALGKPLVQALLGARFVVTAITRESSNAVFPDGVNVRRANPASIESLTKAFSGQDVVIMAITTSESANQNPYIDAAIAAGVKRFIPAEWGHNTRPGKLSSPLAAMLSGKTNTVDYLIEQAKRNPGFTWTGIATSAFLEWGFDHGIFGINLAARRAIVFDSGNEGVSASSLTFIGQSVVAILQREDQTANQYYDVVEHTVSQNRLLELFEEETGAKFEITRTSSEEVTKIRDEKLAKGDTTAFLDALQAYNFADGARNAVKEENMANAELGLKGMDLRGIVREYVKTRSV